MARMPLLRNVSRLLPLWALLAATAPAAPESFAIIARSAQLVMQGARTANGVALRFARPDGTALSVTALSASVDGRHVGDARQGDGSWALGPLPAGAARLEVSVDHDGIREQLSGALPGSAPGAGAADAGTGTSHKQLLWWILNIGVVLIAVLAVSRRMS
jgi:hypothetical protein